MPRTAPLISSTDLRGPLAGRLTGRGRLLVVTLLVTLTMMVTAIGLPAKAHAGTRLSLPNASYGLLGTNVACTPDAEHPYPVVLVHGLLLNGSATWGVMASRLAREGYCVFALDYGQTLVAGGAPVSQSAGQLKNFVDGVLAATDADKVLVVGHSLGGVVTRYYLDKLGGQSKVKGLVSLASPHQGTKQIAFAGLSLLLCSSCLQVLVGSPVLTDLNSQPDVLKDGVNYTQVGTQYFDEFVIPAKNSFLPAKSGQSINLWLNDGCGTSISGHILLTSHPVTLELVDQALANDGLAPKPVCGMSRL